MSFAHSSLLNRFEDTMLWSRGFSYTDTDGSRHSYIFVWSPIYTGLDWSLQELDSSPDSASTQVIVNYSGALSDPNSEGHVISWPIEKELCTVLDTHGDWLLIRFTISEAGRNVGWAPSSACSAYTEENKAQISGPFTPRDGTQVYDENGNAAPWQLSTANTYRLYDKAPNEHGLVHVAGTFGGWSGWIRFEDVIYPQAG